MGIVDGKVLIDKSAKDVCLLFNTETALDLSSVCVLSAINSIIDFGSNSQFTLNFSRIKHGNENKSMSSVLGALMMITTSQGNSISLQ